MRPINVRKLSIVTTLYRSSGFIEQFYRRATEAAECITDNFEIVMVNDGSPDDSLEQAIAFHRSDPRVVVVDLSRNFGHHHAILAGLSSARGDHIFLLDSDLEDQPEWLSRFWGVLEDSKETLDVVYGVQQERTAHRLGGHLFYIIFNLISEVRIPDSPTTARLMTRRYLDRLLELPDKNIFMEGLFAWTGFAQKGIPVEIFHRPDSSYTIVNRIKLMLNSLTSFSGAPLHFFSMFGLLISLMSGCYGLYTVTRKLIAPDSIALGYTSVIASIWFIGGLLMMQLGLIGFYFSKMFREVKRRPQFVIRQVFRAND